MGQSLLEGPDVALLVFQYPCQNSIYATSLLACDITTKGASQVMQKKDFAEKLIRAKLTVYRFSRLPSSRLSQDCITQNHI